MCWMTSTRMPFSTLILQRRSSLHACCAIRRTEDSNKITRQVQEQKQSSPACGVVTRMLISEHAAISGITAHLTATQFRQVSRLRLRSHSQAVGVKSYLNQIKHTPCSRCFQQMRAAEAANNRFGGAVGQTLMTICHCLGKPRRLADFSKFPPSTSFPASCKPPSL